MRNFLSIFISTFFLLTYCQQKKDFGTPPIAKVDVVEEEYYGKKISDPYRYMENLEDSTVVNWFKAQGDFARSVLDQIPGRQELIDKMLEFDGRRASTIYSLVITDNDHYFYLKQTPDDETGKLFHRIGFEGDEELLFDPETYSSDPDKKFVVNGFSPTEDAATLSFGVSANGSEVTILHFMDVATKTISDEKVEPCWSGQVSWLPDGKSFLHNRMRSADVHDVNVQTDTKSYLHRLGEDTSKDKVVLSREDYPTLGILPSDIPIAQYDKDTDLIYGAILSSDRRLNIVYAPSSELGKDKIDWKWAIKPEDEIQNIESTDKEVYLYSSKNAPNFKLLKTSVENFSVADAEVVIPEHPSATLSSFTITNDGLYFTRTFNGVEAKLYRIPAGSDKEEEINLPKAAGSLDLSSKGFKFDDLWVSISGWTSSSERYRYIAEGNEFKREQMSSIIEYPEYEDLVVEELMVPSHDGVKVPLSLIYKKGLKKNGKNPLMLRGYGAYGISIDPGFGPSTLLWTYKGWNTCYCSCKGRW